MMIRVSVLCKLSVEAVLAALATSVAAYFFYVMVGHLAARPLFAQAGITAWEFLASIFAGAFPVLLSILIAMDDKVLRHKG